MNFSYSEVLIKFGIVEDPSKPNDSIQDEVGIVFTHASAKLLAYMLTKTIANYERDTKTEVPLDAARRAEVDALIDAGRTVAKGKG